MSFPNLTRRGFLAATSAMLVGVSATMGIPPGIKLLTETDNEEPVNESKDWITNRGDYYIVHVPENKIFSGDRLDKSTVFYIENNAAVRNVSINGFVNVIALNRFASMSNCIIDASNTRLSSGKERPAVIVDCRDYQRISMDYIHYQ